ncbi:uncharacterized protein LOC105769809 [Gossypium raimondii]|uniref:NAB domain-containing protein n=2 Tax=Gossypium raimondii TaxID=29730 RepID=A0A0D2M3W8_GOSRA|nr:uncharacterized protein LOC105769809 [Gossypium raimondii]KJB11707.1 hypothetical protein B456_001G273400 [Gossypium raimondii]
MDNTSASSSSSSLAATAIPQQSQWLQTSLSYLEEKMKAMMTLLQESDNSKSSCQMAHISHNWKQQLVQMLGELNRAYCSLAHKYDQLRSKSKRVLEASNDPIREAFDTCHEPVMDDSDYEHHISDFEYLNKLADDLVLTRQCNMSFMKKPEEQTNREFSDEEDVVLKVNDEFQRFKPKAAEFEKESTWFQFTKLMEENLRQQAELLRRNNEKRETINRLRLKLEQVKSENKILQLQKCLYCSKVGVKRNHSQNSRSTGLFLGKFFNGGCS